MFNLFKKKCPVCKMILVKGKIYPTGFGQQFCSDNCLEEYRQRAVKKNPSAPKQSSGNCCR